MNKLYIVVPAYNEEEILKSSAEVLLNILKKLISDNLVCDESRILFVNDGSIDSTWQIIKDLKKLDEHFTGISFSRNEGHQKAVLAGLKNSVEKGADLTISIDADLQDDVNAIIEMVKKYHQGYKVVYGVRSSRKKDSFLKRFTAQSYYKLLKFLGIELVYNHADFRLLSKEAVLSLSLYNEQDLYLRGIIPQIGFKSDKVYYQREERKAGVSKYNLRKMLKLASDGVYSFSLKPLRIVNIFAWILLIGGIIASICCFLLIPPLYGDYIIGCVVSLMCVLLSIVLFAISIVGNYVGRTYMESKKRPLYFISEDLDKNF